MMKIELPLLLPTILSAFCLCAALDISAFAIPAWIGAPAKAFDTKAGGKSPLEAITEKIQALLANPNLPGQFDGAGGTNVLGALFQALPQLIAMTGANNPSANTTTNSNHGLLYLPRSTFGIHTRI